MRDTELYFAQKFCWEHEIFVVVKVVKNGLKYRLAISRNGREKVGNQIYESKPVVVHKSMELPNGRKQNYTETIPPVHKKIEELYIDIYRKNTQMPKLEKLQESA